MDKKAIVKFIKETASETNTQHHTPATVRIRWVNIYYPAGEFETDTGEKYQFINFGIRGTDSNGRNIFVLPAVTTGSTESAIAPVYFDAETLISINLDEVKSSFRGQNHQWVTINRSELHKLNKVE